MPFTQTPPSGGKRAQRTWPWSLNDGDAPAV
jgi:hypothetical protein